MDVRTELGHGRRATHAGRSVQSNTYRGKAAAGPVGHLSGGFGSNPERACAADLFEMRIVVTHEWVIDQ